METHVTMVLDKSGQLTSLYKAGGPVLAYTSAIQDCFALARQRVKELKGILENSSMELKIEEPHDMQRALIDNDKAI
ncbi:hypothetical protein RJT34_01371 [Clitoria ternatea]|uniref:Uncharacterized protein n=1 Tax=Clitoria ternatea TaxID=43366 RepID=A0AAN9Q0H7_CLITE